MTAVGLLACAAVIVACSSDDSAATAGDAGVDTGAPVDSSVVNDSATADAATSDANDGAVPYDGETCELDLRTDSPECDQCVGTYCCVEANDCANDGSSGDDGAADTCFNFQQCSTLCTVDFGGAGAAGSDDAGADAGDAGSLAGCQASCKTQFPGGSSRYGAIWSCLTTNCAGTDAAPGVCSGGAFDAGLPPQ